MPTNLADLIIIQVTHEIDRINAMNDQELLILIEPWLNSETKDGLNAGTPSDRFKGWMQSGLLPHCRKLGKVGQDTWDILRDPESAFSKDRIASVILCLSVLSGLQHLDISTLVAIVVLSIRSKSKKQIDQQ